MFPKNIQAVGFFHLTKVTSTWQKIPVIFMCFFFSSYQTFSWKMQILETTLPSQRIKWLIPRGDDSLRASLAMSSASWQCCADYLPNISNAKWFMTCHMLITKRPRALSIQLEASLKPFCVFTFSNMKEITRIVILQWVRIEPCETKLGLAGNLSSCRKITAIREVKISHDPHSVVIHHVWSFRA